VKWLKSLSWVVISGAIFAAAVMVYQAWRAGQQEAVIKFQEDRVKELQQGTRWDINKAKLLQSEIAANKIQARDTRKKSEAALERIGQDETMADIAERFNNKRVRSRKDHTA